MKKIESYAQALKGLSLVLCNNLPQVDEGIDDAALWCMSSNVSDSMWDEDGCFNGGIDIFQYYVTSASDNDVEWLTTHYTDLVFVYSDILDVWVLLVQHYGTSWDYVFVETVEKED